MNIIDFITEFVIPKYHISTKGEITNKKSGRTLKPQTQKLGYQTICIARPKKNPKSVYIHKIVAVFHIPNPNNYSLINHINGNKKDNRVENLEWITAQNNILHAFRTGLKKATNAKLSDEQVREIRAAIFIRGKQNIKQLAEKYCVGEHVIKAAKYVISYKHVK